MKKVMCKGQWSKEVRTAVKKRVRKIRKKKEQQRNTNKDKLTNTVNKRKRKRDRKGSLEKVASNEEMSEEDDKKTAA